MKKIINEKNYYVIYQGKIDELKNQLNYLIELWRPNWKNQIIEDVSKLEKINIFENKEISDMYQRIYYSNEKIFYRVNSSNRFIQKWVFPIMKKISKKADEKFIKKYSKNALEIIVENENNSKL